MVEDAFAAPIMELYRQVVVSSQATLNEIYGSAEKDKKYGENVNDLLLRLSTSNL